MSKKKWKGLVPKLRFPGFEGDWEKTELRAIAEFYKGKGISKADICFNGSQPCIRYGELYTIYAEVIEKIISSTNLPTSELFLSRAYDVIIPSSGETKIDIAKAACIVYDGIALGGDMNIIRSEENGIFLSYYLNGPLKYEIAKVAQGDTVVHLYKTNLECLKLYLPCNKVEQQKIADCLSSLDVLITAHTKKHQAFKTYKKALMQKLFPAEGASVPELRFPGFEDEWESQSIQKLIDIDYLLPPKDGNHGNIHPKSSDFVKEGIPFIMASDIRDGAIDFAGCSKLRKEQADCLQKGFSLKDDVLLTHKGTVGEVAVVPEIPFPYIMLTPQVTYYRVKNKKKLYNKFLAYFFVSDIFQKGLSSISGGGTRAYIGITEQRRLNLSVPTNIYEQQKISDCLSSLDDLIVAEDKKVKELKAHKKSLMQQLFPSVDEEVE